MSKVKKSELYEGAQRRLVASLLYDGSSVSRVVELVAPDDFSEPQFELIFSAILELARKNEVVSSVTVAESLENSGNLEKAGGIRELFSLREAGSKYLLEAPILLYATILKESAAKTKVSETIEEAKKMFTGDSGVQASSAIAELQSALNSELYKLSDESTSSSLNEDFDKYLEVLKERALIAATNDGASSGLQGIPSLLPSINYYTTGWLPGQLITIGARTGVGKTVFAVNAAVAAAQAGKSVLFFSLEMGSIELTDRFVSCSTNILLNNLRGGQLTEEDQVTLKEATPMIENMKIKVETEARITVDSIRAKALRQAQSPEGLDFIILDYLQLVTPVGRYSSRQEFVADVSRNMKLLAKQLNVPVMVLVQVNREDKNDENNLPKLHQIRESGAIAQDSDVVILLHREETLDDTTPHTLVLLEKNRNGEAQKTVRCHSILECSLIKEVVRARDVERNSLDDEEAELDEFDLSEFGDLGDKISQVDFDDEDLF